MGTEDTTNPTAPAAPNAGVAASTPARQRPAAEPSAGAMVTLRHRASSTSDVIDFDGVEIPRGKTHEFTAEDAKRALRMTDQDDYRYFEPVE